MPKTSRRRRSSSVAPPADINSCSAEQLARLPAEVLRLHLASRHLVTSGSKATMAKRLYDALNPSATDSNDASRSQVAPSPSTPPSTSTLSGNTPPSTNQLTTASAVHSPALQAQLSSLMAQFLQYATQPASISHEAAPGAARTTSNLSLASTVHASEQPPPSLAATLSLFSAVAVPPRPTTVTATSGHPAFTQHTLLPPAIPLVVQPQIPTAYTAPTAAAPTYSAVVQPAPIPTLLPPSTPTSGWIMQQPPYQPIMQPAAHPMTSDTLPPVPAQIRQKIIQGEFIDFSVLLHKATFPDAAADPLPSAQQSIKKISSFVMWMQAWNLYLSVILSHNPAKVLEMIPYQRLICSATTLLPAQNWLQYDAKFRTLAAANPLLRWDQRHSDLWLECLAPRNTEQQRWPCPYCKATTHFPENCPRSPFRDSKPSSAPPEYRKSLPPICGEFNQGRCTRANCNYRHICLSCQGNHPRNSCRRNQNRPIT